MMIWTSDRGFFVKEGDYVRVAQFPARIAVVTKINIRTIKNKDGILFGSFKDRYESLFDKPLEIGDEVTPTVEVKFVLDEKGNPMDEIPDWEHDADDADDELGPGYDLGWLEKIEYSREKRIVKGFKEDLDEMIRELTIKERKLNFLKNKEDD